MQFGDENGRMLGGQVSMGCAQAIAEAERAEEVDPEERLTEQLAIEGVSAQPQLFTIGGKRACTCRVRSMVCCG